VFHIFTGVLGHFLPPIDFQLSVPSVIFAILKRFSALSVIPSLRSLKEVLTFSGHPSYADIRPLSALSISSARSLSL